MAEEALYPLVRTISNGADVARPAVSSSAIEAALLDHWDDDIKRAAAHGAALLSGDKDDVEDLAQDARFRMIRALRLKGCAPTPYVRRVIKHAVLSGVRRERRAITTRSPRGRELDARLEALQEESAGVPTGAVVEWVATLPNRQREIYRLIYERGLTQRQVAEILRISQPRIAQLHRALLRRGVLDLAARVA